jgi:hypothetical protein
MHIVFWLKNLKRNRPLRSPRHRWEVNVRLDLREIGWEGVDCMNLSLDREQW